MSDEDDRSLQVKAVAAAFMSVACVTVFLRCYVRVFIVRGFGWDDGFMVLSMLFYLMFSGCMIGGSLYGTGRKFDVLTAHERVTAMKYWWLCEVAYCVSSVACKISVCIFLLRITIKRVHIWVLYTVMMLTGVAGLAFLLIMLCQCKPLQYFWTRKAFDPEIHGSCISMQIFIAMAYVYSVVAFICDLTVGVLPIFIVRNLHMRRQTKNAVVAILSMACIASAAVIVRIPFLPTMADPDFLYATVDIAIWSNIETGLGISAGSLATLRPLLRILRGSNTEDDYVSPKAVSSSRPYASREHPLQFLSMDKETQRFRPDKLAVTVTTIQSQNDPERPWKGLSENGSKERLNIDRDRDQAETPGTPEGSEAAFGIHRTFEVTQVSVRNSASVREHV